MNEALNGGKDKKYKDDETLQVREEVGTKIREAISRSGLGIAESLVDCNE
jgi:hypothetical protein